MAGEQREIELQDNFSEEQRPPCETIAGRHLGRVILDVFSRVGRAGRCALVSTVAANALFAGYWVYNQRDSGEHELIRPRLNEPYYIGDSLRILEWNVESEHESHFRQLKVMVDRNDINVMELQEVSRAAEEKIVKEFPDWSAIFAVGDSTLSMSDFGNMLLVRNQVPSNIKSKSIDGTSLLSSLLHMNSGIVQDAAIDAWSTVAGSIASADPRVSVSINNTKNALQETRAIVAGTIKARAGEQLINVRLATTHISGAPEVRHHQLDAVLDFMQDNDGSNQSTEICADFNAKPPEKISKPFSKIGFITPPKTGPNHTQNGDYCVYNGFGSASVSTLPLRGDHEHMPILFTINFDVPRITP